MGVDAGLDNFEKRSLVYVTVCLLFEFSFLMFVSPLRASWIGLLSMYRCSASVSEFENESMSCVVSTFPVTTYVYALRVIDSQLMPRELENIIHITLGSDC